MIASHHHGVVAVRTPAATTDRHDGAALVEMAAAVGLLALLLFGIITFGVTMSFDQNMTQAANEAARAAATSPRDQAVARATAAAEQAVGGFGRSCNSGDGLTCSFVIDPCPSAPARDCMTVRLTYDLAGRPLVPSIGAVTAAMPEELVAEAIVEVDSP